MTLCATLYLAWALCQIHLRDNMLAQAALFQA